MQELILSFLRNTAAIMLPLSFAVLKPCYHVANNYYIIYWQISSAFLPQRPYVSTDACIIYSFWMADRRSICWQRSGALRYLSQHRIKSNFAEPRSFLLFLREPIRVISSAREVSVFECGISDKDNDVNSLNWQNHAFICKIAQYSRLLERKISEKSPRRMNCSSVMQEK